MLDVTVKTLDSNTRSFSVEDDITVKDFKEKIASSVNIPATTQRLIFRGRVLKDDKKLSEYQCHGQVIHLVEKPPPASTTGSTTRSSTSRSDGQNNFFLGAVHLPAEVTDPTEIQQTVQQVLSGMGDLGRNARVTSRSSADGSSVDVHINLGPIAIQTPLTPAQLRMNQIRSMLRQANTAINTLEATLRGNSSSGSVSSSSGNNYHPTTSASSTPQTQSRSSTTSPRQPDSTSSSASANQSSSSSQPTTVTAGTSGTATTTSQAGPQAAQQGTQTAGATITPPNPRASELAEVMSEVFSLERRLRPFMDRYHTLLVDQPVFESGSEELRKARAVQNVCCQVMHYISHVYHSLSDYNVCMLSRPPRFATVSAMPPPLGPIHFLGSPIPMPRGNTGTVPHGQPAGNTTGAAPGAPRPAGQTTAGAPRTNTGGAGTSRTTGQASQPSAPRMPTGPTRPQMGTIRPNSRAQPMGPRPMAGVGPRGIPLRPQAVRFTLPTDGSSRTFHIRGPQIEIRQMAPSSNGGAPPGVTPLTPHMMQNIAQVIMQQIQQVGRPTTPTTQPTPTTSAATTSATTSNNTATSSEQPQTTTAGQSGTNTTAGSTDPSSSGQQQGNVPRTVRVQVTHQAGQAGGHSVRVRLPPGVRVQTSSTTGRQGPTPTTTASGAPRQQTTSTPVGGSNSTSSTNTTSQSGPRPMPQMNALVGGMWDPFLPCHSRHRNANRGDTARTPQQQTAAPRQTAQQQQPSQTPSPSSLPGMSNVADMISGVMNALSSQMGAGPSTGSGSSPTPGPSSSQFRDSANFLAQMFDQMSNRNTSPENPQTLEQLFSPFANFGEQHGFLNEMAGALYRVLRVNDFSQIMSGNSEPLRRIRPTIVDFINTRILQGSTPTPTNIRTSARRILTENRGEFSEMLGTEPTRHNIDALATYCYFFEEVLVELMTITVGDNAASESDYGDRLGENLQHSIHAGIQLTMYMYGGEAEMRTFINNRLHAWSSSVGIPGGELLGRGTNNHLNRIVENMCVTEGEIMRYVIKNGEQSPASTPAVAAEGPGSSNSSDTMETARDSSFESMEVDGQPPAAAGSSSSPGSSRLATGWEAVVPPSWVPVMTQDIQRQRRQAPQGPFSNAYLHGLPHKRIKLEEERRSRPADTPSFIRETLHRAVENSGVQPRTTVESLLQEAESNTAIHSACDEQMKSALKQRMRSDPDYDPNKFPNTDKYLQK